MEESIRIEMGKKLREMRQKLGYTQEKLADLTAIDYKYIQRIEGKTPPNIRVETIARLAKALKTTPSKLLDFQEGSQNRQCRE